MKNQISILEFDSTPEMVVSVHPTSCRKISLSILDKRSLNLVERPPALVLTAEQMLGFCDMVRDVVNRNTGDEVA